MVKGCILSLAIFALTMPSYANAEDDICSAIDGSIIINDDDEFIGKFSNKFDSSSIFNKFGNFGSQFSSKSIWNKFGSNGNEFSPNSWSNKFSSHPPRIIKDRNVIGYLTSNRSIRGGINPLVIGAMCYDFDPS